MCEVLTLTVLAQTVVRYSTYVEYKTRPKSSLEIEAEKTAKQVKKNLKEVEELLEPTKTN